MEQLHEELLEDLSNELNIEDNKSDLKTLSSKIKSAISEVRLKRNYPSHSSNAQITEDLWKYYSVIRSLALYDYNKIGAEFQSTHNENGTNRTFYDRNTCLLSVFSFVNAF